MLNLLKEVIKVGEATTKYPLESLDLAPGFRGKPVYNPELCLACAACTTVCPPNALAMDTDTEHGVRTWSLFYGRCIFCGRCEEVCPTGAITLSPDFELAAFNKNDLVVRADFKLLECRVCNRYFAPGKELTYVLALLEQAGLPGPEVAQRRSLLEVCPECKRKCNVESIKRVGVGNPVEVKR
ncbi:NADH-quinone oxidoreductase subunit I [Thermoflexales bacterium]|nr:NADH-quinone oxidoreductase subunit I [Thermoflexales bacterium]